MTLDRWSENRRGWVSDEVCRTMERIIQAYTEYRKIWGVSCVNDERKRTERAKADYFKRIKIVRSALHAHNKEVMNKLHKQMSISSYITILNFES